jgi:YD repeat-containing protein
MSKSGTSVQYAYDPSGLRVRKAVTTGGSTATTEYTLNGKLITHLKKGSDNLHFFYDASGRPAMFRRNDAWYYYLQNLQGDIVGIVNSSGALVVEYKYDAWGRQVSMTGSMASTVGRLNPFRYRGYVYDDETGLYFLYVNILPVVNYKPI